MRARFALDASGLVCELREVVLRDKPPELLAASDKATVPVLLAPDGRVIAESLDIMRWALQQNDPGQWLLPQHGSLEDMLQLIARFDNGFKHHLDRYKYPGRFSSDSAQAHRTQCVVYLTDRAQRDFARPAVFIRQSCRIGRHRHRALCAPVFPYRCVVVWCASLAAIAGLAGAVGRFGRVCRRDETIRVVATGHARCGFSRELTPVPAGRH